MNTPTTNSNVTLTADSTVWVGDVEVTLGHVHAMPPAELASFIQWIARTEYERGRDDGEETLAEAQSVAKVEAHVKELKAYQAGRYQGQLEGHAEAFETYQAQLKAELDGLTA
jgi:hypothetical protein